jgi:hypothetical protein
MFKNTDPEFRRPPQELVILFQRLQLHCIPGIDGDVSTVELDVLSILPHPAKDCVLSLENDVQHFGAALRSFPSDPGIPMTESVDLPHFVNIHRTGISRQRLPKSGLVDDFERPGWILVGAQRVLECTFNHQPSESSQDGLDAQVRSRIAANAASAPSQIYVSD